MREKSEAHRERKEGTEKKAFRGSARYDSAYNTTGPVETVSEARDLLWRKWEIKTDPEGRLYFYKKSAKGWQREHIRPLRAIIYREMGGAAGVNAFLAATPEQKYDLIRRSKMNEIRESAMSAIQKKVRDDAQES